MDAESDEVKTIGIRRRWTRNKEGYLKHLQKKEYTLAYLAESVDISICDLVKDYREPAEA